MRVRKVLVGGATGYLGRHLVRELKKRGYWVRALARNPEKAADLRKEIDDLRIAEVTKPETLEGVCDGMDYAMSAVGITRQRDGLSYLDVDYKGNANLLDRALESGVRRFLYVSVFNADQMRHLKIIQAKELFVDQLKASAIPSTIIRPTGFFSDMLEFLRMAGKGRVRLFGTGRYRINPIHGEDLAVACITAMERSAGELDIGGPEVLTHRQIARLAFEVLDRKERITTVPLWVVPLVLWGLRLTTSVQTYGPIEFLMTALTMDTIAPGYGSLRLRDFFMENRDSV